MCGHIVVFTRVITKDQIAGTCEKCKADTILNLNQTSQWVKYDPIPSS